MIDHEQFLKWKDGGYNWLPIICEISSNSETPLTLYRKLADTPDSFLLESGFKNEKWGRFSLIGIKTKAQIIIKEYQTTYIEDDKVIFNSFLEQPLDFISSTMESFKVPQVVELPHFYGGLVGYFGYDAIRYIEPRLNYFNKRDPLNIPDIYLMLVEDLIVHDNALDKTYIIVYVNPQQTSAYEKAQEKINLIKHKIKTNLATSSAYLKAEQDQFISNISREHYESSVVAAKSFFEAGDAMQLILSQRFTKSFSSDSLRFYGTLGQINPSPYMYFLKLKNFAIAGASPEILVRLDNTEVTVRPLAGTRARGVTQQEDLLLEQELLASPKEVAEHLMLIDLGRNDIGKICKIGSVQVVEQMAIERFSYVMHISSTVIGEIKPDLSLIDIIKAVLPAGTVSGAPKIRAMEIIDQLEQEKRGLYGGAVGYLGWHGRLDLAIALRTAIIKDQQIHIQTGAGLVADSNPHNEWQECLDKGRALFLATEMTESAS